MAEPLSGILINIASSILYGLLSLPFSKLLKLSPVEKAISRTDEEFEDIEGIAGHLGKWLEQEETREAIRDLLNAQQGRIDIEHLSGILVEKVGFYCGQESQEKAAEIIRTFLDYLLEEILESEDGLHFLFKFTESVAQRSFADHEQIQQLIEGIGQQIRGEITDLRGFIEAAVRGAIEGVKNEYPPENLQQDRPVVFFGRNMVDEHLLGWLRKLEPGELTALMPSCAVMTEGDWNGMPQADRELLEAANIQIVFLREDEQIPEVIGQLAEKIALSPSREMHFSISFASEERDQWQVTVDGGEERLVDVPWKGSNDFGVALMEFTEMTSNAVDDKKRTELHKYAVTLGEALGKALLPDDDCQRIRDAAGHGGQPPLVTIESDDDLILSLPWELIRMDGEFAVRDGRMDLVRSTPALSEQPPQLSPPDGYMKLVVNVSAPEGEKVGSLNYEDECYRINRALHEYLEVVFTDLGSSNDMVNAIVENEPTGVHFSGHGMPGKLLFEDDEGMEDPVSISDLLTDIRTKAPGKFPRFFYLASCYGNTPAKPEEGQAGSTISAAQLHREGVVQVIGYYGPILETLSTMAEVAIYRELADGRTTRHGVRMARAVLAKGPDVLEKDTYKGEAARQRVSAFPFAWAQLVFYHRGPDFPLSQPVPDEHAQTQEARLERRFEEMGTKQRRILSTGFIGRRRELHTFRRACRERHVFVFQGLGGLGKSALAFKALPMLAQDCHTLAIWCQEVEDAENQAQELANRLSDFGQTLLKGKWTDIVLKVDRNAEATEAQRFEFFLQNIIGSLNHLLIYLDNMESLLKGPDNEDPQAFGDWRSPEVEAICKTLKAMSGDKLSVVASCRYRNPAFNHDIIPVPEMPDNDIFRMMGWFDGLRRLSVMNRARLVAQLHGHPRAVEFLEDLISPAIRKWEDRRGEWVTPTEDDDIEREWKKLISPALPVVEEKLRQNLLLDAIWKNVLDEGCRRMLFRMTVLVRPWDWDLMMQLGEPGEDEAVTEKTAERLRGTSLLEQVQERVRDGWVTRFQIHPMTARFIANQFDEEEAEQLRGETCRRVGTYLEKLAETSLDIRVHLDAGHYLFQCREFDRAYEILGSASTFLQQRGMVRQGMAILEPFDRTEIMERMNPGLCGQMLGTLGLAYDCLAQMEKAVEYYQRALVILKESGDREREGLLLGNLGISYKDLGQMEKAIEYQHQSLEIAKEIGDRRGEGNSLGNLGNAYYVLGQVEKAIEYQQKALVIAKEMGNRITEGRTLGNLGSAYSDLGQMEKAIEYHQQTLVIQKEIGDRRSEGNSFGNLGVAYYHLGQVEKSIEYCQQALVIAREVGDRRSEGNWLDGLGTDYAALGQVEKSIEYYQQALVISREIGDRRGEGISLGNLGSAYAALGQVEKAMEYCQQSLVIARDIGDRMNEGNQLGNLGAIYAALGQMEKVSEYCQQALAIAREIKDPRIEAFALKKLENLEKLKKLGE